MDTLVRSAAVDVVVIDSVAALVPKAELDGEMGDHHIALQVSLLQATRADEQSVLVCLHRARYFEKVMARSIAHGMNRLDERQ